MCDSAGELLVHYGGRHCSNLGTVAGGSRCYSKGTVAAVVWGQWLLQCGDSGCCSVGTVAAAVRGEWLL